MTTLLSGCGSVEGETTHRPFNVRRNRRAALTGSVKESVDNISLDS